MLREDFYVTYNINICNTCENVRFPHLCTRPRSEHKRWCEGTESEHGSAGGILSLFDLFAAFRFALTLT